MCRWEICICSIFSGRYAFPFHSLLLSEWNWFLLSILWIQDFFLFLSPSNKKSENIIAKHLQLYHPILFRKGKGFSEWFPATFQLHYTKIVNTSVTFINYNSYNFAILGLILMIESWRNPLPSPYKQELFYKPVQSIVDGGKYEIFLRVEYVLSLLCKIWKRSVPK